MKVQMKEQQSTAKKHCISYKVIDYSELEVKVEIGTDMTNLISEAVGFGRLHKLSSNLSSLRTVVAVMIST